MRRLLVRHLLALSFVLFTPLLGIHAQDWGREVRITVGETVEGDFAEDVTYVIALEAGQTIFIEVESAQQSLPYIDPGYITHTAEGSEFNAPEAGRYDIRVELPDEDAPSEDTYTMSIIGVEQVETQIGETLTIPAGAESPYYMVFPAEIGDYVRVTADSEDIGIRLEDIAGDPLVYDGNYTMLHRELYFGNDISLAPFTDGIYRAVISAGMEVETFPEAVTVNIEGRDTVRESIAIGETIDMTSDLVTTFSLELEQGQAVRVDMTNDFRGWLHVILPDVGQIYRSGHMASGGFSATTTYIAAADETVLLRVSGASMFPADGAFALSVEAIPVQPLTDEPIVLNDGGTEGFIAVEVEAGQLYRLVINADEEIALTLSNAQSTSDARLPGVSMTRLFETVRVWEADATGMAFIAVSYTPENAPVSLSIETVSR